MDIKDEIKARVNLLQYVERSGIALKKNGSQYAALCPFHTEDTPSFKVNPAENTWRCWGACGEGGDVIDFAMKWHGWDFKQALVQLASETGIAIDEQGRRMVASTKRPFQRRAEYAKMHGVTDEILDEAGWEEVQVVYGPCEDGYKERPALPFLTRTGWRYRAADGESPSFWSENGYQSCWYRLDEALELARAARSSLILCNGEPSVISAQCHGLPATCITGGGERPIPPDLLAELLQRWQGKVIVALDCDQKGREQAAKVSGQFPQSAILDLELSDKGDLGDFCTLHHDQSYESFKALVKRQIKTDPEEARLSRLFLDNDTLLSLFGRFVNGERSLFGRPVRFPFASLRKYGGFADTITTGKLIVIGNASGGGKTILSETANDHYNHDGYNTIFVSPEWRAIELITRRVQRNHHPKATQFLSYMDAVRYADNRYDFSDKQLDYFNQVAEYISGWPGRSIFLEAKYGPAEYEVYCLEDMLHDIEDRIRLERAYGRQIDVVIMDYVQLFPLRKGGVPNEDEFKIGLFKNFCERMDVVGFTTSQVTKEAADRVREYGGFYKAVDLQYVREDKANLMLTQNIHYWTNAEFSPNGEDIGENGMREYRPWNKKERKHPFKDPNGVPIYTPNFALYIVKNSSAAAFKYEWFHFDWRRQLACEGIHTDYLLDTRRNRPTFRNQEQLRDLSAWSEL